jgi:hypothetical protein
LAGTYLGVVEETAPSVWVINDSQHQRALTFVADYQGGSKRRG